MKKLFSTVNKKKLAAIIILMVCCVSFAAAEDDAFGLNSRVKMIIELLNSPWVKGIACIAFVVECILLFTAGRQEPGMFKKFIPWIAGTVLFMSAGTITNKFMNKDSFGDLNLGFLIPPRIEKIV
jgi:trbC/VIRB2 family